MPFQGNPRAGAPSTSPVEVLNLLFQQKANRDKLAFEQQKAAMEAQRQAQLDAAEEDRKNRKAQIDAANALFDLQSKVEERAKTLGEAQATARSQVDQVAAAAPVSPQAAPIVNREPLPAGTFPLMPQDEANAVTQLQAQDQFYGPVAAQQAALANSLKGIPEVSGLVSQVPALGQQAFQTKTRLETEKSASDLKTKLAEERRTEEMQNRAAYRDEAIQLRRGTRTVEAENRFIADKVKAAQKAKRDGNEELYTLLMDDANVVAAQRDAKLTANQPEWAGKNMDLLLKNNSSLDNYAGMVEVLDPIIANPDSIGTEATFRSVVGNAINVFGDLGAAVMPTVEKYAQDDRIDPDVRNKMYNAIVRGVKEDGTPIASAQLAAIRTRWLILNALDPGRVAVAQLNDMENATQFNGLLISQKLATERAKAARNELLQGLDSAQRNIRLLRPEAEFDESGRLIIGGSSPRNAAGNIFGGQSTISGPEATPPAASTGSIGDAIDAAKAALDKPLNGKKNGTAPAQPAR